MNYPLVANCITNWLTEYAKAAGVKGFVVGVSGGIDSAVVSTLCAGTGLPTLLLEMPIHQGNDEETRAMAHSRELLRRFNNVWRETVDLSETFDTMTKQLPLNKLGLANTRSRLRMTALYAWATDYKYLVVGTGNKVEDFGIGFYTKYGDGGVDISPIADLMKSEVRGLGEYLGVIPEIVAAKPTDGLWTDGRTDEDQIGATYDELEWAMNFLNDGSSSYDANDLTPRQNEVLTILRTRNAANRHKMVPIPVCEIGPDLR